MKDLALQKFKQLLVIMDELREKCPWDMKQTFKSIRHLTIEEVYELSDSILDKDYDNIKSELGDILLHIVFYAKIGSEMNRFSIEDVLDSINKKLIERHPHVFGNTNVKDEEEVKENWEKIKSCKGKKSVLDGVPIGLPSIIKAYRIQEKAKGIGFEWDTKEQVWDKVVEEIQELKNSEKNLSHEKIEEEFGDVLFALINYGRFLNINADDALEKTNRKFIKRFHKMEKLAGKKKINFNELSLAEMDEMWNKVKKNER